MLHTNDPMPLQEVYRTLDISQTEAESLLREAKIPPDRENLAVSDLVRVNSALERFCHKLAGRDWRRADGADRLKFGPEIGQYDLFHRKTGQHQNLKTFGQLLRWSESEYGWKS